MRIAIVCLPDCDVVNLEMNLIILIKPFFWEKDGNRGKFIGSNLVIFCYKEFEKFALCKSVSQWEAEAAFVVYSEPIESGQAKFNVS